MLEGWDATFRQALAREEANVDLDLVELTAVARCIVHRESAPYISTNLVPVGKGPNLSGIDRVENLFHPRSDRWDDHFAFREAHIEGLTPSGRATVEVLVLNDARRLELSDTTGSAGTSGRRSSCPLVHATAEKRTGPEGARSVRAAIVRMVCFAIVLEPEKNIRHTPHLPFATMPPKPSPSFRSNPASHNQGIHGLISES